MPTPIQILIVEDDEAVQATWRRVLTVAGFQVAGVADLAQARAKLETKRFQAVLLDLRLGNEYGTDLLPVIETLCPRPGVALITGYLDASVATRVGASEVIPVPKPIDAQTLAELVTCLVERGQHGTDGFCEKHALSPRELQLVRAAANGLGNKQIADLLGCKEATVATYWRRIFDKTDCHSRTEVLALLIHCPRRGHACGKFISTDWHA